MQPRTGERIGLFFMEKIMGELIKMEIKNVVFDLGNVLLTFKPKEFLRSNFNDEGKVDSLYKTVFASPEWVKLDRGTITGEEAINIFIKRAPELAEGIRFIFSSWKEILRPIEGTTDILKELYEKRIPLYVLSNFPLTAYQIVRNYSFFRCFKGLIISAEVNTIKPEPEIYRLLLTRYNLVPEETVFIDDTPENLEGARKLGIGTLHFTGVSELRKSLQSLILI